MLKIFAPDTRLSERRYLLDVVVEEFLGKPYTFIPQPRSNWRVVLRDDSPGLVMPDSFFQKAGPEWLQQESLPKVPLPVWKASKELPESRLVESTIPILAGEPLENGCWYEASMGEDSYLGIDVFGSAFFMLSRYEEMIDPTRDWHDRFPATASLSYKESFLERPIVDEYTNLLGSVLKRLRPCMKLPSRTGRTMVTCDVDVPYDGASMSVRRLVRASAGDIVNRWDLGLAYERMKNASRIWRGDYSQDPNNTFNWMMNVAERQGHQMAFYFIAGHSGGSIDGSGYNLGEPFIQELFQEIDARGHEIGMHGSYNTFRDCEQLVHERQQLRIACDRAGLPPNVNGNRQHYLRWDSSCTPDLLDEVGLVYDTTGGYADRPGFRYGTAREFPMWGWQTGDALQLRQRPLIVMECSLIAERYMGLGYSDASLELLLSLRDRAVAFGGEFILLWHNSHFTREADRWFFEKAVEA